MKMFSFNSLDLIIYLFEEFYWQLLTQLNFIITNLKGTPCELRRDFLEL